MKSWTVLSLLAVTGLVPYQQQVSAFDYDISSAGILFLKDAATGITDLSSIFINDVTLVSVNDIEWTFTGEVGGGMNVIWTTKVNGVIQATGNYSLADVTRELPTSIDCGNITVSSAGTATVEVTLELNGSESTTSNDYSVYRPGVSLIPLLLILCLALTTQMVELSLFSGIFVGACIVAGDLKQGFQDTLNKYLVEALADVDHVYVILFTTFLSGLVGMMQKSGGMLGFTRDIAKIATTPRSGQVATVCVGLLIFFDDYANCLLAGETMRPLMDLLSVSREKLSFLVDATSAPIASISPVSSWVGFEVSLIQGQLDIILQWVADNNEELYITDSAFGIFLQSIKFRYYPIFMLCLIFMEVWTQRDFGPMLVAERRVRIYDRTDGGPNHGKVGEIEGDDQNQPREDQPLLSVNMLMPVAVLVIIIFCSLINTGTTGEPGQSLMNKIENSNSFEALLYGTMGAAWCTIIMFLLQITIPGTGKLCWLTPKRLLQMLKDRFKKKKVDGEGDGTGDGEEPTPRFIMSLAESIEGFLFGMARIFLALIVLVLAWASGEVMVAIGADRLFAAWIVGGIPAALLPTLSMVVSLFMALATGTSWGTMAILFPLITLPTYIVADGDSIVFYATIAGVLAGSVAGDHMSPISDTTVLSSLASDVTLMAHVNTQAPYAIAVSLLSVVIGCLPIGYRVWPNMISFVIGWAIELAFIFLICVPIISPTGRWDIFSKYCCMRGAENRAYLEELTEDCIKKANGEVVTMRGEALLDDDDDMVKKDAGDGSDEKEEMDGTKEGAVAVADDNNDDPDVDKMTEDEA